MRFGLVQLTAHSWVSNCLPQGASSLVTPIAASLSLGQGVFVPGLLRPRLGTAGGSHRTAPHRTAPPWGTLMLSDTDLF